MTEWRVRLGHLKIMHKFKWAGQESKLLTYGIYGSAIVLFAIIGTLLLISSRAATPTTDVEPEDGTIGTCATKVVDSTASSGNAVKLGTCPPPGGFVHPGITNGTAQLDFVKNKIAASAQPWTAEFSQVTGSWAAKLTYVATPSPVLDRTVIAGNGKAVNTNIVLDSQAAVTQALAYYYSPTSSPNKNTYAQNVIKILNAWSSTLTSVNSNSQLDSSWAAENFPRAAEIIRYTYTPPAGQATLNITALNTMLTNVLLPQLDKNSAGSTSSNGNWELEMANGTINIGVFTGNLTTFNTGVAMWNERVPAYLYESTDNGSNGLPITPPGPYYTTSAKLKCFWMNAPGSSTCTTPPGFAFKTGLAQETCRDMSHVMAGIEAMSMAAETARIQGTDLYGGPNKQRIIDGYEFQAKYDMQALANPNPTDGLSGAVQDGVCGGKIVFGGTGYKTGWEIVYNQYANRMGISMPYTLQMITQRRAASSGSGTDLANSILWEMLTNAGTP